MKYSKFILTFLVVASAHAVPYLEENDFSKKTTSVRVGGKDLFKEKIHEFVEMLYPSSISLTQDELSNVLFASYLSKSTDNPAEISDKFTQDDLASRFKDFRDRVSEILKENPSFSDGLKYLAFSILNDTENPIHSNYYSGLIETEFLISCLEHENLKKDLEKYFDTKEYFELTKTFLCQEITNEMAARFFQCYPKVNQKILLGAFTKLEEEPIKDAIVVTKKEKKPSIRRRLSGFFKNKSPKLSRK